MEETDEKIEESKLRQNVFLVYKSNLEGLIKYCLKCGALLDKTLTSESMNTGSQFTMNFHRMLYFLRF